MIILTVFLFLAVSLIVFMVFYIKYLLKKLYYVSDNLGDFLDRIDEYRSHLEVLNEFETYNGDPVIENFIKHTKAMIKELKNYKDIYELTHEYEESEEPESEEQQQ